MVWTQVLKKRERERERERERYALVSKAAVLIGWTHNIWERPPLESRLKYWQFLLRRPVLLFYQLYKLVLRALFRLSAFTLVNCFPCVQASVSTVYWSHFHNSIWNICPWTTVLNCMCITTSRYLHLLNVCENTALTVEWGLLVRVRSCWAVGVRVFIRPR